MSSNEEIIDYIMSTPENANPNVLRGMLENSSGASLPAVTVDDDGMTLAVVNGVWDKVAPTRLVQNQATNFQYGTLIRTGVLATWCSDYFGSTNVPGQIIPLGFRPVRQINVPCVFWVNGTPASTTVGALVINGSGTVLEGNGITIPEGADIYVNATWQCGYIPEPEEEEEEEEEISTG